VTAQAQDAALHLATPVAFAAQHGGSNLGAGQMRAVVRIDIGLRSDRVAVSARQ